MSIQAFGGATLPEADDGGVRSDTGLDAVSGVPVGETVESPTTEEPEVQQGAAQAPPAGEKAAAAETRGPIPYERFEEVVRSRQALEGELQPLRQLRDLYKLAEKDPSQAAQGFEAVAKALRSVTGQPEVAPALDVSLMTDTERALYDKVQRLESAYAHTARSAEQTSTAIANRELDEAMRGLESWSKDQGYPFDAERVIDAMDSMNIEGLMAKGKSTAEIAQLAYKATFFDELPKVVAKKTYGEQMKKSGAALPAASSRSGMEVRSVNSVRDAVELAWRKHNLPEPL